LCFNVPHSSPAAEILDYLARHPQAQDTIEGILQWWVLEACVRKWAPQIERAVAELVAEGLLEEKKLADGRLMYGLSPQQRGVLQGERPPAR
jgi:hypothetical protein